MTIKAQKATTRLTKRINIKLSNLNSIRKGQRARARLKRRGYKQVKCYMGNTAISYLYAKVIG